MQRFIDRDENQFLVKNIDPFLPGPPLYIVGTFFVKGGIEMRREKVEKRTIIMAGYPGKKIKQG
jgi:hypothetical protein